MVSFTDRQGEKEPILFIHGLGADRMSFDAALRAPELLSHRLILPDLPGFGDSLAPANYGFRLTEAASAMFELLDHLKIKQCSVVGHSMGGAIGILLAEHFAITHFVNAVGNLVTEDTLFSRRLVAQDFAEFVTTGFAAFKRSVRIGARKDRPLSSYANALEKTSADAMYRSARDLVEQSDMGQLLERFVSLDCKKLYLYDQDNPVAARIFTKLGCAGVPHQMIPDTGHALMEENPAGFYGVVAQFLSAE